MAPNDLRDAFGTYPLYVDAEGRTWDRIDAAGKTTLSAAAVRAWNEGAFSCDTPLVKELTPVPLSLIADAPRKSAPDSSTIHLSADAASLAHALDLAIQASFAHRRRRASESVGVPEPAGVAVHCLLSGGIDSAAVVDALHRAGHRVIAHALIDDAVDAGELNHARALTSRLNIELVEHRIHDTQLPAFFSHAVVAAERPIFNARGVSLALFMHSLARSGVQTAFCGIGADEVFHPRRADIIRSVFEPKTLPPTVWAARSFGVKLLLPYLTDNFVSAADGTGAKENKRAFREAMAPRLGADLCFAAKTPRMFKKVSSTPLWRDILKGGDDAAALTAASFDVLERHFVYGPHPPRDVA